jgi:hypothetical protein
MNMVCGTGFCAGKIIAVLVAVSAGGYASYNYTTSGTLLGSCSLDEKAAETEVAYEQLAVSEQVDGQDACCAADAAEEIVEVAATDMAGCSMDMDPGSCSMTGETAMAATTDMAGECTRDMGAATTEVAATTDGPACEATGICPMTGEPMADKDCPMNGDAQDCPMGGGDAESCHATAEDEVAASETADDSDG